MNYDFGEYESKFEKGKLNAALEGYKKKRRNQIKIENATCKVNGNQAAVERFENFDKRGREHRDKCRNDLMLLHEIVEECEFLFGLSTRRTWMYFSNNTNSLCFRKNNRGTNGTAQF